MRIAYGKKVEYKSQDCRCCGGIEGVYCVLGATKGVIIIGFLPQSISSYYFAGFQKGAVPSGISPVIEIENYHWSNNALA